jgi:hypothetical protein
LTLKKLHCLAIIRYQTIYWFINTISVF